MRPQNIVAALTVAAAMLAVPSAAPAQSSGFLTGPAGPFTASTGKLGCGGGASKSRHNVRKYVTGSGRPSAQKKESGYIGNSIGQYGW